MGSSAKRKKEKKKDFQKPKLKVGKAKPKPTNFTDTSFKAGAVHLGKQSINVEAPSESKTFSHHLSLLRHPSASQRQESLAYLASVVASQSSGQPLPEPTSVLLLKICQLMLDPSQGVRQQLLKFLSHIQEEEIRSQIGQLLHWVVASMMQMSQDVSLFSLDVLHLLLSKAPLEVVSSSGGWTKILNCFLKLLGWQEQNSVIQNGWSSIPRDSRPGSQGKTMAKQLSTLTLFLKAGLSAPKDVDQQIKSTRFPLTHFDHHQISCRSNAFAHLDLFGAQTSGDNELLEDREDRQRLFHDQFEKPIERRLEQVKREGGEVGRASATLAKTIAQGMSDFEKDET